LVPRQQAFEISFASVSMTKPVTAARTGKATMKAKRLYAVGRRRQVMGVAAKTEAPTVSVHPNTVRNACVPRAAKRPREPRAWT
jgi:hypothetical protein